MLSGLQGGCCLICGLLGVCTVLNANLKKKDSHYSPFRLFLLTAGSEVLAAIPICRECSGPAD